MSTWVYFASPEKANEADTLRFAINDQVICYGPFRRNGTRNNNAGRLAPGDALLLVYLNPPGSRLVRLCARIALVDGASLIPGTKVFRLIGPPLANALGSAGYDLNAVGQAPVIQLQEVHDCDFALHGTYNPKNAINRLDNRDSAYRRLCRSCSNGEAPGGSATSAEPRGPARR